MPLRKSSTSKTGSAHRLTLSNREVAWHYDWTGGTLRTSGVDNHLSGRRVSSQAPIHCES